MVVQECLCLCIQVFLDRLKDLTQLCRDLIDRYDDLLSRIAAHDYDLSILDIFRSDLDTRRDTEHLLLAELPPRALLGIIDLRAVACCLQRVKQLIRFVKYAFFVLRDRDHSHLYRRDPRREHQTTVIAVYHDDRPDDPCGQPP